MEKTKAIHKYPRSAGVLLPVTMLHGPFGIGVLGAEAKEFIDFLSAAGFHAWQVLPVEHTSVSFSPYKCISAFAGEPMLIDPRMLLDMGLITDGELSERISGTSEDFVNYEVVREKQWSLLRTAYERFAATDDVSAAASNEAEKTLLLTEFRKFNPSWLNSYALYMAIKHRYDEKSWYEWPDVGLRSHDSDAIKKAKEELRGEFGLFKFIQWLFHVQWQELKEYAASKDVSIIGDMPFYVSEDSVEVWNSRNLFDADEDGNFLAVAGAPPDYFSPLGQHWGNPIYNWKLMKKNSYKWWVRRIKAAIKRYDFVRIDHFRGFESYWRIPAEAPNATFGEWVNGPGIALFKAVETSLGNADLPLVAEDLGDTHGNVEKLLKDSGYRGMRVIQFGFLGDEKHLPHSITEDCVAYTGTHDNTTMLAWLFELSPEDRERALFYIGYEGDWTKGGPNSSIMKAWIRSLFITGASLAVVPIQDLLGYGADTRTNIPGTPDGNWRFRIHDGALGQIDAEFYKALIKTTERDNALQERGKADQ